MRIVFFGTPEISATILRDLARRPLEIVGVVSRPDKPKGRSKEPQPTAVKQAAIELGLPLFQPVKVSTSEFADQLSSFRADLFVVVAYAEILKESILEIPPLGCINVHGSLLPKYRGAAPIQRAIMAGERLTGVSIMRLIREMDAGAVYAQQEIPISDEMTSGELFIQMAEVGKELLWKVIQELEAGRAQAIAQEDSQATFAPKVTACDREVDWNKPAQQIHDQIRGLTPNPGAYCYVSVEGVKKRVRIWKTRVHSDLSGAPGQVFSSNGAQLIIACTHGALELLDIQPEGKRIMSTQQFLCGTPISKLNF